MGHATIAATEMYLRLTPEIYPDITEKFEEHFGGVIPIFSTEEQCYEE